MNLNLNIEYTLAPLKQTDPRLLREPIGSGGLMMALYHYHRFLTIGAQGVRGRVRPRRRRAVLPVPGRRRGPEVARRAARRLRGPADQARLDRLQVVLLAERTTRCSASRRTSPGTRTRARCTSPTTGTSRDGKLPHRIEVRYGDKRYAILTDRQVHARTRQIDPAPRRTTLLSDRFTMFTRI